MPGFSVDNDCILICAESLRAVPDLFNERTGGIILLNLHALVEQQILNFYGGPKGWDDHHILRLDFLPGDELSAIGIHDEPDTPGLQIVVDLLVMNHLAQQKHTLRSVLLKGLIADLDCIFNAIAESKMAGQVKDYGTKIQHRGRKILLAQVFYSSDLLYPSGQG